MFFDPADKSPTYAPEVNQVETETEPVKQVDDPLAMMFLDPHGVDGPPEYTTEVSQVDPRTESVKQVADPLAMMLNLSADKAPEYKSETGRVKTGTESVEQVDDPLAMMWASIPGVERPGKGTGKGSV